MSVNIDAAIEQLYNGEVLSETTLKEICSILKQTLSNLPNVSNIRTPISIVGNIHGYVMSWDTFL